MVLGSDNIDASLWRETWKTEQITVDGEKVTTYVPGDMKGNRFEMGNYY